MNDTPVDHGAYYSDEGSPIMGEPIMDDEPIMDYEPDDQAWTIMDDRQADHVTDEVDDQATSTEADQARRYSVIVFTMIGSVQHKIEDVPEDTIKSIFKWLSDHRESSACKIEIPPENDLEQTLTIMRDKIVSIETYSSPMGGG